MNPNLNRLEPYPFTKLRSLLADATPPSTSRHITLGIGEPQHAAPEFVLDTLKANLERLSNYPSTLGLDALRHAIANWLTRRFRLSGVDASTQILPVNGTREALFAFAQCVVANDKDALVISPNPFYQIYEGATLLAGAQPLFLNCTEQGQFQMDIDEVTPEQWQRCQLLYLCTPGNPTGAVMSLARLSKLIDLAHEHDFIIASDECYSEIYSDEDNPPPGLLQACAERGDDQYRRCVVFHSLSKRSNLPGLRSGFVAGDADVLAAFLQYRTYHGCAMPLHHQLASIAAWEDEAHVRENRGRYREKFAAVQQILAGKLSAPLPEAGFYLWPRTPVNDLAFAKGLFEQQHVTVLPGQFLARNANGVNPGENHVRMALVASLEDCIEAAERIAMYVQTL